MSWKLALPCTREEAERIADAELEGVVLMTSEVDEATGAWRLDAYFDDEPGPATIAAVRELAASGGWSRAQPEELPDADWVTMSQAGLEPIREGRFVVHTGAHAAEIPTGGRAFRIEAGEAFGTGHHATTGGCLAMLDAMADWGFDNAIDIGTGTGLLAFAVKQLWPWASVTATDIDPKAIQVARANAAANDIAGVDFVIADGTLDDAITARAPYGLVIANILAGPLVSMAPELTSIADAGATIILAGLLDTQRQAVTDAYIACGCTVEAIDRRGDWTILRLTAGTTRYVPTAPFDPKGRDGWALDL